MVYGSCVRAVEITAGRPTTLWAPNPPRDPDPVTAGIQEGVLFGPASANPIDETRHV